MENVWGSGEDPRLASFHIADDSFLAGNLTGKGSVEKSLPAKRGLGTALDWQA
jgi:hypothetical protein